MIMTPTHQPKGIKDTDTSLYMPDGENSIIHFFLLLGCLVEVLEVEWLVLSETVPSPIGDSA